jgi:D-serine deaminase-like pyridoxal phosphate-dependent protein
MLRDGGPQPAIGDRVEIIPNHVCAAVNLFDTLVAVRGGEVVTTWPILARGKVR